MNAVNFAKTLPRLVLATPFRLFAIYVCLFCAAVAAVFIYAVMTMMTFLDHEVDASVRADFDFLAARYREGRMPALVNAIAEHSEPANDSLYLLTDRNGRWLAGNLDTVAAGLWETKGAAEFSYRKRGSDQRLRPAYGVVSRLPDDLHLIVARDVESQETLKRRLRRAFLIGYALIMGIGAAGAVMVSRRMLRRVDAASSAARSIMQGNLAQRIPITGRNDEFDRLSKNLNAMLDRI